MGKNPRICLCSCCCLLSFSPPKNALRRKLSSFFVNSTSLRAEQIFFQAEHADRAVSGLGWKPIAPEARLPDRHAVRVSPDPQPKALPSAATSGQPQPAQMDPVP